MTMPRSRLASALLACALTGFAQADDYASPGPFAAGRTDVTVTRPNGTSFLATLHYPALSAGVNAPFDGSGGPYPIVSFGHGFLQPVSQYQSTLAHLASRGFFAIASQSNGGFAPSHSGFAADLRFCVDWLVAQGAPGGIYAGAVAGDRIAFAGHSMGGGSALLAARDDPRERAVVTLAAAETNPSSIAASALIDSATRLIVGSQDTIVPPATSAQPMYANLPGPRQLCTIQGGFHCGFTDADFLFCDSGSITRASQLATTRALMARFLELHLVSERAPADAWRGVWGPESPAISGVTLESDSGIVVVPAVGSISATTSTSVLVEIALSHDHPSPTALSVFAEGAERVGFDPSGTPEIDAGAVVSVTASIPMPATQTTLLVSARRDSDLATRGFATIALEPTAPKLPADLDGDGVVGASDLAILLGAWGGKGPADLDGDGIVGASDLAILLGAWN
jgi:predicted dienelactone hydrolase